MVPFKGAQYPKDVILFTVFFDVRYVVSYRDLEEIMSERGIAVDHTTFNGLEQALSDDTMVICTCAILC